MYITKRIIVIHLDTITDVAVIVLPLFIGGCLWLSRWMRRLENMFMVTGDVTRNHLPFIYKRLKVHDEVLNLYTPEHPNIVLLPNGSGSNS